VLLNRDVGNVGNVGILLVVGASLPLPPPSTPRIHYPHAPHHHARLTHHRHTQRLSVSSRTNLPAVRCAGGGAGGSPGHNHHNRYHPGQQQQGTQPGQLAAAATMQPGPAPATNLYTGASALAAEAPASTPPLALVMPGSLGTGAHALGQGPHPLATCPVSGLYAAAYDHLQGSIAAGVAGKGFASSDMNPDSGMSQAARDFMGHHPELSQPQPAGGQQQLAELMHREGSGASHGHNDVVDDPPPADDNNTAAAAAAAAPPAGSLGRTGSGSLGSGSALQRQLALAVVPQRRAAASAMHAIRQLSQPHSHHSQQQQGSSQRTASLSSPRAAAAAAAAGPSATLQQTAQSPMMAITSPARQASRQALPAGSTLHLTPRTTQGPSGNAAALPSPSPAPKHPSPTTPATRHAAADALTLHPRPAAPLKRTDSSPHLHAPPPARTPPHHHAALHPDSAAAEAEAPTEAAASEALTPEARWVDLFTRPNIYFKPCQRCTQQRPAGAACPKEALATFFDVDEPQAGALCGACRAEAQRVGHRILQVGVQPGQDWYLVAAELAVLQGLSLLAV
jgi:hypothetical protein